MKMSKRPRLMFLSRLFKEDSNSKTLIVIILKDSSVRSIWTYLTASPCYTTNTKKHDYTTSTQVSEKSIYGRQTLKEPDSVNQQVRRNNPNKVLALKHAISLHSLIFTFIGSEGR